MKLLSQDPRGFIFDIQGFSVHDGPGCRTVVFLAGCPWRCRWCSNPEGQEQRSRLMYRRRLCRGCGRCASACPWGAIRFESEKDRPLIERKKCKRCDTFDCISRCWSGALTKSGRYIVADELFAVLNRDRNFWGADGGISFSGGDPFVQHEFLKAMLQRCRDAYIHTAVETCGHVAPSVLRSALPLIDWIFFDIKHIDSKRHRRETGVDNSLSLTNLKEIKSSDWPGRLLVRLTLIPGVNDDSGHLRAFGAHLRNLGIADMQLLPYHRLGQSKYDQLGLPSPMPGIGLPQPEALDAHRAVLQEAGLTVYLDSDAPF